MLQIVNLFLEKPDKLGKIFFLIIQLLLTIWVSIELIDLAGILRNADSNLESIWTLSFLGEITLFNSILFLLFIAFIWTALWVVLPDLLLLPITIISKLLIQFPLWVVGNVIAFIFYFFFWVGYKFKIIVIAPVKFWKKNIRNQEDDFKKRRNSIDEPIRWLEKIDRLSGETVGAQIILAVLNFEKVDEVLKRMHQYFMVLILFIFGLLDVIVKQESWVALAVGIAVLLLGLILLGTTDLLYSIRKVETLNLERRALDSIIFSEIIDELKISYLAEMYDIKSFGRKVNLVLKKDNPWKDRAHHFPEKIVFVMAFGIEQQFLEQKLSKIQIIEPLTQMTVFISDLLPDTFAKNLLHDKKLGYIYYEDGDNFEESLLAIRPFLYNRKNLKQL